MDRRVRLLQEPERDRLGDAVIRGALEAEDAAVNSLQDHCASGEMPELPGEVVQRLAGDGELHQAASGVLPALLQVAPALRDRA